MTKRLFAGAIAAFLWTPHAMGQSILHRSAWQERKPETHLPPPGPAVPWLDLTTKTKRPKGDLPLRRDSASAGHFVLPSIGADRHDSSNAAAPSRSM